MCQNTGSNPDGGLARRAMEESAPACLPSPKTDLPSHATWRCQDSTQTSEVDAQVMVCTAAGGASYQPGRVPVACGLFSNLAHRVQCPHCSTYMRGGCHDLSSFLLPAHT